MVCELYLNKKIIKEQREELGAVVFSWEEFLWLHLDLSLQRAWQPDIPLWPVTLLRGLIGPFVPSGIEMKMMLPSPDTCCEQSWAGCPDSGGGGCAFDRVGLEEALWSGAAWAETWKTRRSRHFMSGTPFQAQGTARLWHGNELGRGTFEEQKGLVASLHTSQQPGGADWEDTIVSLGRRSLGRREMCGSPPPGGCGCLVDAQPWVSV